MLSIPRGYVWNAMSTSPILSDGGLSIPRGYVWNWPTSRPRSKTISFQSHEGTSGTSSRRGVSDPPPSFQSHEGTSGTGDPRRYALSRRPFNPTRVRLELTGLWLPWALPSRFQSHEGTSGTRSEDTIDPVLCFLSIPRGYVWNRIVDAMRVSRLIFQSHEGTSGTTRDGALGPLHRAFNPTRVRLEHSFRPYEPIADGAFNPTRVRLEPPLLGAIESLWDFQSHEGTSGTGDLDHPRHRRSDLSIPRGYVWNTVSGLSSTSM